MSLPHPVVVTGASTGIGRATTTALVERGLRVFPTVRREADAAELRTELGELVTPLVLDVTDQDSVGRAADVVAAAGPLSGLVNNAGVAVPAPLEYLPLHELRRQLEVNLVGQLGVTQAMLPALRRGRGRIVTLGSIADRIAGPLLGAYAASKFGLLGLTDALRTELSRAGIRVILIEPGAIATPIWSRARASGEAILAGLPQEATDRYGGLVRRVSANGERAARQGLSPDAVAAVIIEALTHRRPRPRYLVGRDAQLLSMVARLPHRLRYRLLAAR